MSRMSEDTFPWILKFQSGKTWFDTLRYEKTKEIYLTRLKQYCDAVSKNPDELIALKVDGLRNVATAEEFQAEALLNNYLYNSDLTSNVQIAVLASAKSF
ncbi:hypothetical protein MUP42_01940, partial [Candidatus Bathyarchaeota archaeon]|nr:hypothetical protein [Candidatus Bathyarchaeota archaeon]